MKIVGLITEYNPFHNGHKYHIEQALEVTGADAALVVMSGNFVQRGTPAIMPKHLRTEIALKSGAAAVIELPVCYATGSAEYFAMGAVSLLNNLGCVDSICFGTECDDPKALNHIAEILADEPPSYRLILQRLMKSGLSYPLARQEALGEYTGNSSLPHILGQPNNILGIEYLKALYKLKSRMKPYTIQRKGSGYHDEELGNIFSSASAIRNVITSSAADSLSLLKQQVPDESIDIFAASRNVRYPVFLDDLSLVLRYKLLQTSAEQLTEYADVTEELANRIIKCRNNFVSFEQFCSLLKTKQLTYTRISRALIHIILDIKNDDMEAYLSHNMHGYARLLGFRKDMASILTMIKEKSRIPLLSKLTRCEDVKEPFQSMLEHDIFASDLYESVITEKFKTPFINEYEHPVVRI